MKRRRRRRHMRQLRRTAGRQGGHAGRAALPLCNLSLCIRQERKGGSLDKPQGAFAWSPIRRLLAGRPSRHRSHTCVLPHCTSKFTFVYCPTVPPNTRMCTAPLYLQIHACVLPHCTSTQLAYLDGYRLRLDCCLPNQEAKLAGLNQFATVP